jgi:hypothetical protein
MRLLLISTVIATVLATGACADDEASAPSEAPAPATTSATETSSSQPPAETTDASSTSSATSSPEDDDPLKDYEFTGIGYDVLTGDKWVDTDTDLPTLTVRDGKIVTAENADASLSCDLVLYDLRLSPATATMMMDDELLRGRLAVGETGTFTYSTFDVEIGQLTCTRHM